MPGVKGNGEENRRSAHILPHKHITGPLQPVWGLSEADCPSVQTCPYNSQGGCDFSPCHMLIIHVCLVSEKATTAVNLTFLGRFISCQIGLFKIFFPLCSAGQHQLGHPGALRVKSLTMNHNVLDFNLVRDLCIPFISLFLSSYLSRISY